MRGDLIAVYSLLGTGSEQAALDLFTLLFSQRTQANGLKLHQGRFRLDTMKKFFTDRVVDHRNKLPTEVIMDPASWMAFKKHLDNSLIFFNF